MPSQILHTIAGRSALPPDGTVPLVSVPAAFNLGCQGPDIFSHNRRTKPFALAYSRLLHRHEYGRFCATFAKNLVAQNSPLLESWFYGFVTHPAVERILHPYIVNRSWMPENTGLPGVSPAHYHAFFERILDARFFFESEEKNVSCFDTGSPFFLEDTETAQLAKAIALALHLTWPLEDTNLADVELRVKNAFSDAIYFYQITNPVITAFDSSASSLSVLHFLEMGYHGVALLYPETLDSGTDWLNLARNPWRHPASGETLFLSVPDLFDLSVKKARSAVTLVNSLCAGLSGPEALEAEIGNECLSVCGDDGKIGTVNYSESFDLRSELIRQEGLRREWLAKSGC
jgi:hypothetical protein